MKAQTKTTQGKPEAKKNTMSPFSGLKVHSSTGRISVLVNSQNAAKLKNKKGIYISESYGSGSGSGCTLSSVSPSQTIHPIPYTIHHTRYTPKHNKHRNTG